MKKWIFAIIIAAMFVLWPLLRPGFYVSDDGEWMVIRLSAFYQSLSSGQFPVRYLGRLNNSYGYPVANFLYPGFLYIGSILHRLGASFPDAIKIILGGSIIGSALFMFFALRRRFSNFGSFVGTLNFLFSPYLLYDLYRRGSVGELLALLPSSMIIYALVSKAFWLVPPATAFLIVSHNTTALLVGVAVVAVLFAEKRLLRLIPHLFIGLGLSAFFWMPALFERKFVLFDLISVSNPFSYFISLPQAAILGIPTLICIALSLRVRAPKRAFDWVILIGLVLAYGMSLPMSSFLWHVPVLAKVVQFPYRFLTITVLFSPWIVAGVMDVIRGKKRIALLLLCGILWMIPLIFQVGSIQFVNRPIGFYTTNEGTTTVANEYMPRWVSQLPIDRSLDTLEVLRGDVNISPKRFTKDVIDATIEVKDEGLIQINKIYYPGWGVTVDGVRSPIDYKNSSGLMQITVPAGSHSIHADFRETPQRFFADVVSVACLLIYLVFFKFLRKAT